MRVATRVRTCRGLLAFSLIAASCASRANREPERRITPEYDAKSGRLNLLKYDSTSKGVIDTWCYMDGSRVIRIDIDTDGDGKVDRWEHYDAAQRLEKVGISTRHDGVEDAWQFLNDDGSIARVEISLRRDGKVTRVEHYEHGRLLSAEEDDDEDGRMDKWETYEGERLASVAFDTTHRGTPDRRLIYAADGRVSVHADPGSRD